jgi:uncharacterized protein (TIGR00730 family)
MSNGDRPRICVYCASRPGTDPEFTEAASDAGRAIVGHGADLVFGGGGVGLMGVVTDAVLDGGGHVIGVTPEALVDDEFPHPRIQDLRIVADVTERKRVMFSEADAFLTLPGGIGTMEEMFEMLSWGYLGVHRKPMGLLAVGDYFDHLVDFLDHSVRVGLTKSAARDLLLVDDDAERLVGKLLAQRV